MFTCPSLINQAPHTFSADNSIKFGYHILVKSKMSNGYLVIDIGEKIISNEEEYAVTVTPNNIGAITRSIFAIERVSEKDGFENDLVHYGQPIRFRSNDLLMKKPLYLRSLPTNPQRITTKSKFQEVSMHPKPIFDTVWTIEHQDPNLRTKSIGQEVKAKDYVLIKHDSTAHYLASDLKEHKNDFGYEYEVSVHSYATTNKSQQLILEKTGKLNREQPTKFQYDQNSWQIITSDDPTTTKLPDNPKNAAEDLTRRIKKRLMEKGMMGIRALSRIFKSIDIKGTNNLDPDDFRWGLFNYGIKITKEDSITLVSICDKENNGTINFNLFLSFLKGENSDLRNDIIKKTYSRLYSKLNGKITFGDISSLYDTSKHPEVISKKKTEDDLFKEFITEWGKKSLENIITQEEFFEFFKDVSPCIEKDDYFLKVVFDCWKI